MDFQPPKTLLISVGLPCRFYKLLNLNLGQILPGAAYTFCWWPGCKAQIQGSYSLGVLGKNSRHWCWMKYMPSGLEKVLQIHFDSPAEWKLLPAWGWTIWIELSLSVLLHTRCLECILHKDCLSFLDSESQCFVFLSITLFRCIYGRYIPRQKCIHLSTSPFMRCS